jgi:putative transposase
VADQYALELSRYLHLNPVRAGMVEAPEDYRWSSYSSYIGIEQPQPWLDVDFVLGMFSADLPARQQRYREFVEDLIGKEYDLPLQHTVASTILGSSDFVETIMTDYLEQETERPDVPAVRALNRRFAVENIIGKTQELVDDPKLAREVALHISHRYSGEMLKNIGAHFGLGDSAVVKASTRLEARLNSEAALSDMVKEILRSLGRVKVQT